MPSLTHEVFVAWKLMTLSWKSLLWAATAILVKVTSKKESAEAGKEAM
jgi:hypothetical protein